MSHSTIRIDAKGSRRQLREKRDTMRQRSYREEVKIPQEHSSDPTVKWHRSRPA
jgi:hypothetical protein